MGKKILLAVDESKNSLKAIQYVAETFQNDAMITLLTILPDPAAACDLNSPSLHPLFQQTRNAFCTLEDKKRESVQAFINSAKETLVQAGFQAKNIHLKLQKRKKGIARDILAEAKKGDYSTIVVGRRGLSSVKEFLLGSVSNKVLQGTDNMAVVIVD